MADEKPKKVPNTAGKIVMVISAAACVAIMLVLNRTTEGAVPGGAVGGGIGGGVGAFIGIVIANALGMVEEKQD